MTTPEVLVNSFELYQKGDKGFCKLASVSDEDTCEKNFGFWFEVIRNEGILVVSIRYESLTKMPAQLKFFRQKQLEDFLDEARQLISSDLEKIIGNENPNTNDKLVA